MKIKQRTSGAKFFFNNSGINKYNVHGVNTNAEEWARHDKTVEGLRRYERNGIAPGFDLKKAIKTSKQLYCGCNYRFDQTYIEQAIFFEIIDDERNNSVWFLLPDNRVLLYLMQGTKVLSFDYSAFGDFTGVQYPCALFDIAGLRLNK